MRQQIMTPFSTSRDLGSLSCPQSHLLQEFQLIYLSVHIEIGRLHIIMCPAQTEHSLTIPNPGY